MGRSAQSFARESHGVLAVPDAPFGGEIPVTHFRRPATPRRDYATGVFLLLSGGVVALAGVGRIS